MPDLQPRCNIVYPLPLDNTGRHLRAPQTHTCTTSGGIRREHSNHLPQVLAEALHVGIEILPIACGS